MKTGFLTRLRFRTGMTFSIRYVVMLAIGLMVIAIGAVLTNTQVQNLISFSGNAQLP